MSLTLDSGWPGRPRELSIPHADRCQGFLGAALRCLSTRVYSQPGGPTSRGSDWSTAQSSPRRRRCPPSSISVRTPGSIARTAQGLRRPRMGFSAPPKPECDGTCACDLDTGSPRITNGTPRISGDSQMSLSTAKCGPLLRLRHDPRLSQRKTSYAGQVFHVEQRTCPAVAGLSVAALPMRTLHAHYSCALLMRITHAHPRHA